MNKRKNKQNMVNIYTNMWENQISKTCKLKQTICQSCLKFIFDTKTSSWWSNWYKIVLTNNLWLISNLILKSYITNMQKIVYEISTDSLQCLVIYVRSDACTISKQISKSILSLKSFLKRPISTLYTLYNTLANTSVVFQKQRPLESSHCNL